MTDLKTRRSLFAGFLITALGGVIAQPEMASGQIQVTIENNSPDDGFFFTPVWLGLHDGSFDVFSTGELAGNFPGLEQLAEGGDTSVLSGDFNSVDGRYDQTILSPGGFPDAPVFDPGETVSVTINVPNPTSNRYLSFASMVIPSNDAFFANGNPTAYEVFDSSGDFTGPLSIVITGSSIYDSGTEVNDMMGAAFSALGGTDSEENVAIALHAGLDGFLGTDTVAGTTLGTGLGADTVLATITVNQVPEPAAFSLLGLGGLLGLGWLRRRQIAR